MGKSKIFLLLAVLLTQGCGKFEESFKQGFKEEFDKSCIASANKKGGNVDVIRAVCTCSSEKLISRYSVVELAEFRNPDGPKASKILEDTVKECVTNSRPTKN